jgi:hypothetical protein
MTTPEQSREQESLEARLLQIWTGDVPEDQTVEEVFGPYESWLLSLGTHQLLLHPVLKEWLYLDPLHDTWERTGFGPEEVVFVVQGGRLGARKKDASAGGIVCPSCGHRNPADASFCARCGTRLDQGTSEQTPGA